MIRVLRIDPYLGTADLSVVRGCLTCGRDVAVRATPQASWTHCGNCRRVAQAKVTVQPEGIKILEAVGLA